MIAGLLWSHLPTNIGITQFPKYIKLLSCIMFACLNTIKPLKLTSSYILSLMNVISNKKTSPIKSTHDWFFNHPWFRHPEAPPMVSPRYRSHHTGPGRSIRRRASFQRLDLWAPYWPRNGTEMGEAVETDWNHRVFLGKSTLKLWFLGKIYRGNHGGNWCFLRKIDT